MRGHCTALGLAAALLLQGCNLDISRERLGVPLKVDEFEVLELERTTVQEAVERLGAPDKVEPMPEEQRLWWFHGDRTVLNLRFQLPFSFFGYRHNLLSYFQGAEQTNSIYLVFNEDDVLEEKSLNLPAVYRRPDNEGAAEESLARIQLTPRVEQSFLIAGDADIRDFSELFELGQVLGLDLGVQLVAPLTFSLGGRYQTHEGQSLRRRGSRFDFSDLDLFTLEALLRVQVPLWAFERLNDFDHLRKVVFERDPRSHDGWVLFVEGGLGLTHNEDVGVRVDGQSRGDFFDSSVQFSNSAASGIEYSAEHVSVRVFAAFRSVDGFDSGESRLPDDAGTFQTWLVGAAVALKF